MKVLIIDDEQRSINQLKLKLETHFHEQFDIKTALGPEEGQEKISTFNPELVFLDIQMPGMNGFELLATLPHINFKIIFITGYNQYAIKAIRFNALDYLIKPVIDDELIDAIKRFNKHRSEKSNIYNTQVQNFLGKKYSRLAISSYQGITFLEIDKIIRCEAELNYTKFFLAENKKIISSKTLKEYEELLDENEFIRVHRSHLVNINYVVKYKNDGHLILIDNTMIPVSRRKKDDVLRKIRIRPGLKTLFKNSIELI